MIIRHLSAELTMRVRYSWMKRYHQIANRLAMEEWMYFIHLFLLLLVLLIFLHHELHHLKPSSPLGFRFLIVKLDVALNLPLDFQALLHFCFFFDFSLSLVELPQSIVEQP